jgi:hypothetical protein
MGRDLGRVRREGAVGKSGMIVRHGRKWRRMGWRRSLWKTEWKTLEMVFGRG